ncbi:MAG: TatD family hydrolase [Pseudomonadota bacterium]
MSKKKRRDIPRFGQPIIETHCHLDYLEADELVETLQQSSQVGVDRFITIAVSESNQDQVRALADAHAAVYCTQGVHPHDASHFCDRVEQQVREGCEHPKVVAVGEIGLDYFYENASVQTQWACFEAQLTIAAETRKPVVIHTREAESDTQAILSNYRSATRSPGVLHSFSSAIELAEFALSKNWYLGFNGMVTFKNAEQVRRAVVATPLDRILLETDSPYLTPEPYRGRKNRPYYLPFIAEKIAELKEVSVQELLAQCHANSEELFFSTPDTRTTAAQNEAPS